jgi:hypothetical protein
METVTDGAGTVQREGLVKALSVGTQAVARNPLRWFVFAVVIAANVRV